MNAETTQTTDASNLHFRDLTAIEIRVLGTLMEKARTVPDSYPLTLNTLVLGCNQKTSRDPVMDLHDEQVQSAIDSLKSLNLVIEQGGGRVMRYAQNFRKVLNVGEQHAALLGLLLLRGPQTAAELRTSGERWYKFSDVGLVELFLTELTAWNEAEQLGRNPVKGSPLVVLLPRAHGAREQRWMHLIGGPVSGDYATGGSASGTPSAGAGDLQSRITVLEQQVEALQLSNDLIVAQLKEQLGLNL